MNIDAFLAVGYYDEGKANKNTQQILLWAMKKETQKRILLGLIGNKMKKVPVKRP